MTFTQAPAIEHAVGSTTTEGLIGLLCAAGVVFVFLLSVRMTLIALVSIPLSLLAAALTMHGLGYSLNLLTLGALTLAIGRLVDDSIVVVESVERSLRVVADRRKAAVEGTAKVAKAVLTSTLTTVAVFLPLLFVGGATGALFRPFAVTASIALLASLLVSLTIVPVLAFWFLRPSPVSAAPQRGLSSAAERLRVVLESRYRPIAQFSVRRARLVVAIGAVAVVATLLLIPGMPTSYFTGIGQSYVMVVQQERPDIATDAQAGHVDAVEDILAEVHGVTRVRATIGTSGNVLKDASLGGGSGVVSYSLTLSEGADPGAVSAAVQKKLDSQKGFGTFSTSIAQEVGFASDIEVKVAALDDDALKTSMTAIAKAIRKQGDVRSVTDTAAPSVESVDVVVNRAAARKERLTESDITAFLESSIARREVATAVVGSTVVPIVLEGGTKVSSIADIGALKINGWTGVIPLSSVAKVVQKSSSLVLQRANSLPSGSVFVTLKGDDVGGGSEGIAQTLEDLELPDGTTFEVAGVTKDQGAAFVQLLLAFGASILIVYVILVAAFRSLLQPLVLLISVPFAVTGVIVTQRLSGGPLGVSSLIGALMLVGIAVTNAIVLVDRVNQLRAEGMPLADATVEGAAVRLRPVLMTAAATVLALVPMAFGFTGQGGLVAQPLAIVVIGGMVSSTLLTLVVLPAALSLSGRTQRSEARVRSRRGRVLFAARHEIEPMLVQRGGELFPGTGRYRWVLRSADGDLPLLLVKGDFHALAGVGVALGARATRRIFGAQGRAVAALVHDPDRSALQQLAAQTVACELTRSGTASRLLQDIDGEAGESVTERIVDVLRRTKAASASAPITEFVALRDGDAVWAVYPRSVSPDGDAADIPAYSPDIVPERRTARETVLLHSIGRR